MFFAQHLKRNIQDIEITRCQVPRDELAQFDQRIGPSYQQALASIDSFMKFQNKYKGITEVHCNEENTEGTGTVTVVG